MNLGPTTPNQAQNEFGSLVFLEISYSDSLQKFLTLSRGKTHEKTFWVPNLGQKSQNQA